MPKRMRAFWSFNDGRVSFDDLRSLLHESPDLLQVRDEHGEGLITKLVSNGCLECLAWALRLGGSPNGVDREIVSPLVRSAELGGQYGKDAAILLLSNGADIESGCGSRGALHVAVSSKWSEMVQLLIDFGANINAADADGYSPLHLAVLSGQADVVQILLQRGADVNVRTITGSAPKDLVDPAMPSYERVFALLNGS